MSSSSPPSENLQPDNNSNSDPNSNSNSRLTASSSIVKLRKIPPIPIRQSQQDTSSDYSECSDEDENDDEDPVIVQASALGLNHIRTRSDPSRLRFASTLDRKNSNLTKPELPKDAHKVSIPLQHAITLEPGRFFKCYQINACFHWPPYDQILDFLWWTYDFQSRG